ncbi:hypothetical protein SBA4_2620005 [Candidatus Sulfopaludibacter sp. SbA4]|nr:hypothetical protein SBA4_2620005 [Candidatus Sulfopaludibacter sp. SbA4]
MTVIACSRSLCCAIYRSGIYAERGCLSACRTRKANSSSRYSPRSDSSYLRKKTYYTAFSRAPFKKNLTFNRLFHSVKFSEPKT